MVSDDMRRFVDTAGLAEYLHVAPSTIRAWVRLLDIPVTRIGKLVRYEIRSVNAWIDKGGPGQLAAALRREARTRQTRHPNR